MELRDRRGRGAVSSPSGPADALGLGRSTVSNLLAAMERSGLITRRARADDRRQVDVLASADALDCFDRFDQASAAIVAEAAASLAPEERMALEAAVPALEQLRDALLARQHAGSR